MSQRPGPPRPALPPGAQWMPAPGAYMPPAMIPVTAAAAAGSSSSSSSSGHPPLMPQIHGYIPYVPAPGYAAGGAPSAAAAAASAAAARAASAAAASRGSGGGSSTSAAAGGGKGHSPIINRGKWTPDEVSYTSHRACSCCFRCGAPFLCQRLARCARATEGQLNREGDVMAMRRLTLMQCWGYETADITYRLLCHIMELLEEV